MPPPGDGTPRGAGAAGGTPENASGRAAAAIEAAAGEFEHEFNLAMLPGLGAEEIGLELDEQVRTQRQGTRSLASRLAV